MLTEAAPIDNFRTMEKGCRERMTRPQLQRLIPGKEPRFLIPSNIPRSWPTQDCFQTFLLYLLLCSFSMNAHHAGPVQVTASYAMSVFDYRPVSP